MDLENIMNMWGDIDGVQKELLPKILSTEEKLVVEFALHPISYRIGDESYRHRILNALPKNRKQSFFLSKQSFFFKDFYDDAGEVYKDIEFEHLLIVTQYYV